MEILDIPVTEDQVWEHDSELCALFPTTGGQLLIDSIVYINQGKILLPHGTVDSISYHPITTIK